MNTRSCGMAAAALVAVCLGLAGCGGGDSGGTKPKESAAAKPARKISAEDRKTAEMHYKTLCVTCHGATGKGDGPAGKNLDPKPRNWTDPKWQDSVTDEHLFQVILEGGAAAKLSPLMPANLQFKDRPGVIWALVEKVRSFRGK